MSAALIAFFSNKSGAGKTSLVYHLAWMYADLGTRVVAADLDPQANLSAAMEASLTTEFEASAGLPLFAKVKAALKALVKTGSSTLKEIQQEAERRPPVLHDAVNALITHVQEALHKQGRRSLVIIADGLEKIPLYCSPLDKHHIIPQPDPVRPLCVASYYWQHLHHATCARS